MQWTKPEIETFEKNELIKVAGDAFAMTITSPSSGPL
jgi:hypothetical protein